VTEIDEGQLFGVFDELDRQSLRPFQDLKAAIDRSRSARFGVPPAALRPWHYTDRFFQKPDPLGDVDLDALFADRDPAALATATYDGLGLDVRPILSRSDLYPRAGKNQHAFCTHIDRQGDIRTLNNLEPNERWTETLHHELGHGVYEQHLDSSLPWLLRAPAHTLSTEAVALLMGGVPREQEWLTSVLGVAPAQASAVAAAARERDRASSLVFTRWCLVMTHFERGLYADPEADLDSLWWDLVERHQQIPRPEGRHAPDWAAKIHVALFPVYYHNYELGLLVRAQLRAALQRQVGGLVGRPQAGTWLIEHVFRPGASLDWNQHVAAATGEPLTPRYFVEAMG
jgi:peptidyl-dipeptidase A